MAWIAGALFAGCSKATPVDGGEAQGPAPTSAAEARRIFDAPPRGHADHLGHTLTAPSVGFRRPGELLFAAGGGFRWVETKLPEADNQKRDPVELFGLQPRRTGPAGERALLRLASTQPADRFGYALAFAPGLLGSADRADLAVGAPRGPQEAQAAGAARRYLERGAVYLFAAGDFDRDPDGAALRSDRARLVVRGDRDGERLGMALLAAGDLDGDGTADLVVGAPGGPRAASDGGGRVLLLSGARLRGIAALGARAVDLSDGLLGARELARGAPGEGLGIALASRPGALLAGGLEAHFDPELDRWVATAGEGRGFGLWLDLDPAGEVESARRLVGGAPLSRLGQSLVFWESPDGPVALVGAPFEPAADGLEVGAVFAFGADGGLRWRLEGDQELARFGFALAVVGDGAAVAVGEPDAGGAGRTLADVTEEGAAFRRGRVRLFALGDLGGQAPAETLAAWVGEGPRDHLGFALADGGPLSAGEPGLHVLAGALAWPFTPATEQGRVYLLHAPRP